jgi:deoxyribonuclease-4
MRIGFHVAIEGGWRKALQRAVDRRCGTLQVFTSAPVQWAQAPLNEGEADWFAEALRELDIQPLFVHAIYLLNLATDNGDLWERSRQHLRGEVRRAARLGAAGVVVHLGSVGEGGSEAAGLRRVARAVDFALRDAPGEVRILLENCAGQGALVGCTPEALGEVISRSRHAERIGVCLDTAHAFARGYALHTPEGLQVLLEACQGAFGMERLRLVHANGSLGALGSRRDRHWHIGQGEIGRAGFANVLNHPWLAELPFIMETPSSEEWDGRNLRALRRAVVKAGRPALPRITALPGAPGTGGAAGSRAGSWRG